jgi:predicted RecA/RadA family phage recombinase
MMKGHEYMVNEGNKIGYLPTEFGANQAIVEKKIVASADVAKGQVVELTGSLAVAPTTEASAKVIGVAMFDAKAGEAVAVETEGLFKLKAASTITGGAKVASAAAGKVAVGTDKVIGIALNDAGTDEYVYVKFSI